MTQNLPILLSAQSHFPLYLQSSRKIPIYDFSETQFLKISHMKTFGCD
jgi:hypothetical protein